MCSYLDQFDKFLSDQEFSEICLFPKFQGYTMLF